MGGESPVMAYYSSASINVSHVTVIAFLVELTLRKHIAPITTGYTESWKNINMFVMYQNLLYLHKELKSQQGLLYF